MESVKYVKSDEVKKIREEQKHMSIKDFIEQCVWSLDDYREVRDFIFRVKEYIHIYGAYTLGDLKNEMLFLSIASLNDEIGTIKHADYNKGWVDATGFDFEILGKHSFKIIIPWDNYYEDLTAPLVIKDREIAEECGIRLFSDRSDV